MMATILVQFRYLTGLKRQLFRNVRLKGSWNSVSKSSEDWSETPMTEVVAEDGCPSFIDTVQFDAGEVGRRFRWGVVLDGPEGKNQWGIPTEVDDAESVERTRSFVLEAGGAVQTERYLLTYGRWMGAQKLDHGAETEASLRRLGAERKEGRGGFWKSRQRLHRR